jgi:hypothetical protein
MVDPADPADPDERCEGVFDSPHRPDSRDWLARRKPILVSEKIPVTPNRVEPANPSPLFTVGVGECTDFDR